MNNFLQEQGLQQERYVVYCDSQSVIHLSKNSTFHSRFIQIDVHYHCLHDMLENKELQPEKVHTSENDSYMFIKTLPKDKLEAYR